MTVIQISLSVMLPLAMAMLHVWMPWVLSSALVMRDTQEMVSLVTVSCVIIIPWISSVTTNLSI
jgi:hypothetical protein